MIENGEERSVWLGEETASLAGIKSFWCLIASQISEQFGDSLNLLVILATLTTAFGDNPALANTAMILPMMVPIVLLGPVAGVFVDRYSKRMWLLSAAAGRGIFVSIMALVATATASGSIPALAGFLAMIFLISCLWQFYNPARSAALPEVVPPRHLDLANSISVTVLLFMQIIGYIAGGLLGDNVAPAKALWINAACYVVTGSFLLFIRFHAPEDHAFEPLSPQAVGKELLESLKALFSPRFKVAIPVLKVVLLLLAVGLAFTSLQGFSTGLSFPRLDGFADFLQVRFGLSVGPLTRFTLLLLSGGLGAGLAVVLLSLVKERIKPFLLIQAGLLIYGLVGIFLPEARSFAQAAACVLGMGLGGLLVLGLTEARIQRNIPPRLRGKVLSGYFLARSGAVAGGAALPGLLKIFNLETPRRFFLGLSAWTILAVALASLLWSLFGPRSTKDSLWESHDGEGPEN